MGLDKQAWYALQAEETDEGETSLFDMALPESFGTAASQASNGNVSTSPGASSAVSSLSPSASSGQASSSRSSSSA